MLSKLLGGSQSGGAEMGVTGEGVLTGALVEEGSLDEDVAYTVRLFLLKAGEYLECIWGAGILKEAALLRGTLVVLALLANELCEPHLSWMLAFANTCGQRNAFAHTFSVYSALAPCLPDATVSSLGT